MPVEALEENYHVPPERLVLSSRPYYSSPDRDGDIAKIADHITKMLGATAVNPPVALPAEQQQNVAADAFQEEALNGKLLTCSSKILEKGRLDLRHGTKLLL